MPRFHLPPESWPTGSLTGDEARHLTQVLRLRAGDAVTVFDGQGTSASATILSTSKDQVALTLGEATHSPPLLPAITLAQAIPKQKNMDLIVQKAVELGVSAIQPLVTRHTIVHPGENKADKWRRIALEACKQCGQNTLPTIHDPLPFDRWLHSGAGILAAAPSSTFPLIASLAPGAQPLRDLLKSHTSPASVTILIGPEGDFSPEETAAALAAGFLPASLGSIVLRVETASLFCLSALRYEYPA
jgi:16S rRNA (uracil1498-N3)-methyltransferase